MQASPGEKGRRGIAPTPTAGQLLSDPPEKQPSNLRNSHLASIAKALCGKEATAGPKSLLKQTGKHLLVSDWLVTHPKLRHTFDIINII